jgi:hypothetical protein
VGRNAGTGEGARSFCSRFVVPLRRPASLSRFVVHLQSPPFHHHSKEYKRLPFCIKRGRPNVYGPLSARLHQSAYKEVNIVKDEGRRFL